jgi:hypothetical protein
LRATGLPVSSSWMSAAVCVADIDAAPGWKQITSKLGSQLRQTGIWSFRVAFNLFHLHGEVIIATRLAS